MQELIDAAKAKFGIDESGAKTAVGGLLQIIQEKADPSDFGALVDRVPGAEKLVGDASGGATSGGGGGGLLGGALASAASAIGGRTGTALGVGALLEKSGLKLDDAGPFVTTVMGFFREKAGDDLVGKILAKVPALAKLAG